MGRNARLRAERKQGKTAIAPEQKYLEDHLAYLESLDSTERHWLREKNKAQYWLEFESDDLILHVSQDTLAAAIVHGSQIIQHVKSLLSMSLKSDWTCRDRTPFLGDTREQVRRIGQDLNQWGGFELMQAICSKIPSYDQKELDWAWHGIGEWKS